MPFCLVLFFYLFFFFYLVTLFVLSSLLLLVGIYILTESLFFFLSCSLFSVKLLSKKAQKKKRLTSLFIACVCVRVSAPSLHLDTCPLLLTTVTTAFDSFRSLGFVFILFPSFFFFVVFSLGRIRLCWFVVGFLHSCRKLLRPQTEFERLFFLLLSFVCLFTAFA